MSYKLRLVQYFNQSDRARFLELEQKFIELEQSNVGMTSGKRYLPVSGKEPSNTLIWEAEFETLDAALNSLTTMDTNEDHKQLLDEQIQFMRDAYVEVYRSLD